MADFIKQLREESGDEYNEYSDTQIANAFHQKYQDDTGQEVDFNEFASQMGFDTAAPDFGSPDLQSAPDDGAPITAQDVAAPDSAQMGSITPFQPEQAAPIIPEAIPEPGREQFVQHSAVGNLRTPGGGDPLGQTPDIMETMFDPWTEVGKKFVAQTPEAIEAAGGNVMAAVGTFIDELGFFKFDRDDPDLVTEAGKQISKTANEEIQKTAPKLKKGSLKEYAFNVAIGTRDMGLAATASVLAKNPSLGLNIMMGQVYSSKFTEALNEGKSKERAMLDGTFYAMTEGWTEKIPLGVLTQEGGKFLSRTLKSMGAEFFQETFAEAADIAYKRGIFKEGEELTLGQMSRRLWDAGLIGMGVGGSLAVITSPTIRTKGQVLGESLDQLISETEITTSDAEILQKFEPGNAQMMFQEAAEEAAEMEAPVEERRKTGVHGRVEERRADIDHRRDIGEMSQEEQVAEIEKLRSDRVTDPLTGIGNRTAYDEAEKLPVQVSIDADSLKWVNDNMSPEEGGDVMLKAIGQAISEETGESYHISGDEYMVQTNTEEEAVEIMERVGARLKEAEITVEKPDGTTITKTGIDITYGTGVDKNEADNKLKQEKIAREQRGERAGRGQEPPGVVVETAEGKQDRVSEPAAEEVTDVLTPEESAQVREKTEAEEEIQTELDFIEKDLYRWFTAKEVGEIQRNTPKESNEAALDYLGKKLTEGHKRGFAKGKETEASKARRKESQEFADKHGIDIKDVLSDPKTGELIVGKKAKPKESKIKSSRGVKNTIKSVFQPGATYVPMLRGQAIPGEAESTTELPKEVVRREHIIKDIERRFKTKIYTGRVKGKSRLGFFRPLNREVRTKFTNDLEITAHEFAHLLDDRYPAFSRAYKRKPYKDELLGVSYDLKDVSEGFAEFARLYMTQEIQAIERAPFFYAKFIEIMESEGLTKDVEAIKEKMHLWYLQGALGRGMSKIGVESEPIRQRIAAAADGASDHSIAATLDALHGVKVMEADLAGSISDADLSPYKLLRLVAGSRGVTKAVLNHGTVAWDEKGDIVFTGDGLLQVFNPVAHVFDETMAYFAARRAKELFSQNRENLFQMDEIEAMLALGETHPEIKKAFDEYQKFNKRMMDFYQQSGLLSKESRAAMEEMNKDYVPFNRVQEEITGEVVTRRTPFKRLKGGTANVADIFDNITFNTSALVHQAILNHAKQETYAALTATKEGARYAVHIAKETLPVGIEVKQVQDALLKSLGFKPSEYRKLQKMHMSEPVIDQMLEAMEKELGDFVNFFTFGNAPKPKGTENIDSVMVNGKQEFYDIKDPLFMKAMESFNARPRILAMRVAMAFKHGLTRGVTSFPGFQVKNLIRDTVNAATMSHGGIMPFVDSIRGMTNKLVNNDIYWEFMANGGGFSSTVHGETQESRRKLERLYLQNGLSMKNIIDTPRRMLDMWDEAISAFEYGTRIAEYKALRKKGKSRAEAAFQSREISTDFAMHGYSNFLQTFTSTVPFMNARIQGLYRLEREMFEKNGKQALRGEFAGRFAFRGLSLITLPTLMLYLLNMDDERYKALPDWKKDLFWVIYIPGREEPFFIPKPFETGAIFATIPERTTELMIEQNGDKFGKVIKRMMLDTFALDPTPQIIKPLLETEAFNRKFTGSAVVPSDLKGVLPSLQHRPWTSPAMVQLGKELDISPMKMEHWIRGYLGTLGSYSLLMADSLVYDEKETGARPEKALAEKPFFRQFLGTKTPRMTQYATDFYDLAQEVDEVVKSFGLLKREGRGEELREVINVDDRKFLLGIKKQTGKVRKMASELNKASRVIQRSKTLTDKEKAKKLEKIREAKNKLMKKGSTQLNKARLMSLKDSLEKQK